MNSDESTTRYPAYTDTAAGAVGAFDDYLRARDEYGRYTSRATADDLEDDVRVPGEEDVVSNFEFHETVLASCPICGSEIRARLVDKGSNGLLGDIKITLHIISKTCECPKVYLLYDN